MSVIVTDKGFAADDWTGPFRDASQGVANDNSYAVDLPSDTDPATLARLTNAPMIRIAFPSFADGRGFTLAAMLRRAGFQGRLRARGHVLADQYAMARRSGFDEVEIDDALAARQPQDQWLARADWQQGHYQARLRGFGVSGSL
ncbi:DUF934 domain-containing protein [Yoonia vestfoldensis]|uniref:DUF934 domain-containing protein n=1 Tax=Yoonia vestfoldensis TaxID=245188 RepID=UPI00036091F0|nr:DUF934 domain-containing protein [Yoonia vestfoldensis]